MDLHRAHLKGLLAYFSGEITEIPPPGGSGTVEFAYRAEWLSGKHAMEAPSGRPK